MSGQDIALALTLDGAEANDTIEKFNKHQEMLVQRAALASEGITELQKRQLMLAIAQDKATGGTQKFNDTLKVVNTEMLRAQLHSESVARAYEKADVATNGLSTQMRNFSQRLAPQAAAISSISNALGQTSGTAGKVVGSIGQLTAAFAAGGPFSAALVGGTVLVNALSDAWDREIERQDAAIANDPKVKAAEATHIISERITALRQQLGVDTGETEEDAYKRLTPAVDRAREAVEKFDEVHRRDTRTKTLSAERSALEGLVSQAETLRALEAEAARKQHEKPAGPKGKRAFNTSTFQEMEDADALLEKKNKQAEAAWLFQKQAENEALESAEYTQKALDSLSEDRFNKEMERYRAERDAFDESRKHQIEVQRATVKEMSDLTKQYVGEGTAIFGDYVSARITGEKNAEAAMVAAISRVAGQHLIGHGINLAGAAVVSAATGLLPLAAIQGAEALGLIAAGVGLGGVATGISHVSGGGKIGSPLTEQGVNKGSGRNTRTGQDANSGEVYIFNNYGVSGPLADDQVRALERTQARANRRSMS